ncbi:MAG: thioredoxin-disulfide reductase, partial [Candidatus Uhrbacteria bacterium]|nr:thioredoxin-disulfide reductase [Candidatus Uhrbacteria bacterium]
MESRDVVIIGSGPAGYTAAIYSARANMRPLMIAGMQPGGQLTLTSDVENWPGEPDGVMGPDLMEKLKKQAARFGTDFMEDIVTEINLDQRPFVMKTASGAEVSAKAVIIATGASAMWLGVPGEERLQGRGVSACATCDGFFFRGKEIVVVGGGDTAMEEATFLTRFASKITLIHRRDEFKASKIMVEKAKNNPKIVIVTNTVIEEILGDEKVSGVRVKNVVTGEVKVVSCEGFFVAIGHKPNTSLFGGKLDMDATGYLMTEPRSTKTNIEG